MSYDNRYYLNLAASMLWDDSFPHPNPDPDYLHIELVGFLTSVQNKLLNVRADLKSRQIISIAITTWESINPDKEAYSLYNYLNI